MARLYKRGETWWATFYDASKRRHRVSTRCTDRRAAETVAARLEREAADPRHSAAYATTLDSALMHMLADRAQRGRAAGTVRMYQTKAAHLVRVLGRDTRLGELTAAMVDHFIAMRTSEGAERTTIGKELTTLRVALKLAKRRGELVVDVDAIMPVGWAVGYKPRARVLRRAADLQRLVNALLPDRAAHMAFMLATGARYAESIRARRSDIDLEGGMVRIRGTKTAGAAATIPLVWWQITILRMVVDVTPDSGPMFRGWGNVGRELPDACRGIGLEPLTPNDLRRTCATWLRAQGVEPSLLAGVLRHRDSRMVERVYGRIAPDALGTLLRARVGCDTGVPDGRGFGASGASSGNAAASESASIHADLVPRDGIEPPTRGFSIRASRREYDERSSAKRDRAGSRVTPACQRKAAG